MKVLISLGLGGLLSSFYKYSDVMGEMSGFEYAVITLLSVTTIASLLD